MNTFQTQLHIQRGGKLKKSQNHLHLNQSKNLGDRMLFLMKKLEPAHHKYNHKKNFFFWDFEISLLISKSEIFYIGLEF